jgi:hypothetical protein
MSVMPSVAIVLGPEKLDIIQQVYDECLQKLVTCYAVGHPAELNDLPEQVARRLMTAARSGIHDPQMLQVIGLRGMLPDVEASLLRHIVKQG